MEAPSPAGLYAPRCKLAIEFDDTMEQRGRIIPRLAGVIRRFADSAPWFMEDGPTSKTFEIGKPTSHPETHPDYGRRTNISFYHRELLLSGKQLWAYEKWAIQLAHMTMQHLSPIGLRITHWDVAMTYTTPPGLRNARSGFESGDVVRMPNGTLAVVTDCDILCAGHVKELTLRPVCGIFRHLWLVLTNQLRPIESEIEGRLEKIGEVPIG